MINNGPYHQHNSNSGATPIMIGTAGGGLTQVQSNGQAFMFANATGVDQSSAGGGQNGGALLMPHSQQPQLSS